MRRSRSFVSKYALLSSRYRDVIGLINDRDSRDEVQRQPKGRRQAGVLSSLTSRPLTELIHLFYLGKRELVPSTRYGACR